MNDNINVVARRPTEGAGSLGNAQIRPTPVSSGIESVAERVGICDKLLGALESRLGPILSPPPPGNDKASPRRTATCDLDDRIITIESHLEGLAAALETITARVRV